MDIRLLFFWSTFFLLKRSKINQEKIQATRDKKISNRVFFSGQKKKKLFFFLEQVRHVGRQLLDLRVVEPLDVLQEALVVLVLFLRGDELKEKEGEEERREREEDGERKVFFGGVKKRTQKK